MDAPIQLFKGDVVMNVMLSMKLSLIIWHDVTGLEASIHPNDLPV